MPKTSITNRLNILISFRNGVIVIIICYLYNNINKFLQKIIFLLLFFDLFSPLLLVLVSHLLLVFLFPIFLFLVFLLPLSQVFLVPHIILKFLLLQLSFILLIVIIVRFLIIFWILLVLWFSTTRKIIYFLSRLVEHHLILKEKYCSCLYLIFSKF